MSSYHYSQTKVVVVVAASAVVILARSEKPKLAVEETDLSVVEMAVEAAAHALQVSAVATPQVLPLELTHHVTLTTKDYYRLSCLLNICIIMPTH